MKMRALLLSTLATTGVAAAQGRHDLRLHRSRWLTTTAQLLALLLIAACDGTGADTTPTTLAFGAVSAGQARTTLPAVTVEIHNASGGLVPASDAVTLELGSNAGRLLFHASGASNGDRIIELVDPVSNVVLPTLQNSEGPGELLALVYDSAAAVVWGTDLVPILWRLDPVTGHRTMVDTMVPDYPMKGLALEPGPGGRLLGVSSASIAQGESLYAINRATAQVTNLGRLTIAGDSLKAFNGLSIDPTSGTVFAIAQLKSNAGKARTLVHLNASTLTLTSVGVLSEDGVAGITFLPNGTLIAVTGDGATHPEQLWSVNKTTGAMSFIMALGNGADGEAITTVPATLTGTLTRAAVAGVATFSDLQISASGTGYTLKASAPGLSAATSAAFAIAP
jgi:hypothetical protein